MKNDEVILRIIGGLDVEGGVRFASVYLMASWIIFILFLSENFTYKSSPKRK